MPEYDFRTLSSYDFELLVRDLLQAEFNVRVESFRQGRDQGIDLRYAAAPGGAFIAQCKHYGGSGFAKLVSHLAVSEKEKVTRLAPARYILATSVPLTPLNKAEILGVLAPHCLGPSDVLGREDLNNLLGRHPEVERQHFKLWLSSTTVLDRLVHSRIYTQTELALDAIQEELCLYVQNDSYTDAHALLDELHYCIICGIPGIGKTMLADILLVSLIGAGYEAIKLTGTADEALTLFKKGKPQVFYYDDFLGQTSLQDQKLAKNEDQQLLMLIDRVQQSEHHRFLLTTREYILNQAKAHYERLETSRFDVRKCVVTLEKYTVRNRCQILFNHLYFSRLPKEYVEGLLGSGAHRAIVKHRNFNPRVIQWMTTMLTERPPVEDYGREFIRNLDHPQRLWEHAYSRQLSLPAQILLLVLGSLPAQVFMPDAERAFTSAWSRGQGDPLAAAAAPPFMSALRELDGTFIKSERQRTGKFVLSFHNPSIRDFVEYKLRLNGGAAQSILERAAFFEQIEQLSEVMRPSPSMSGAFREQWAEGLCKASVKTLSEPGCTIGRVQHWRSNRVDLDYWPFSLARRARTALALVADAPIETVRPYVDGVLAPVLASWKAGTVSTEHVESFLDAVVASPHVSDQKKVEVTEQCADALIGWGSDVRAFQAYADLWRAGKIPQPSENSLNHVRDAFMDALDALLDVSDFSDRYSANEALDEVEAAAKALGVDVTDDMDAARERVGNIKDPDFDPADEPPSPSAPSEGSEAVSDAEIDDIFSAL